MDEFQTITIEANNYQHPSLTDCATRVINTGMEVSDCFTVKTGRLTTFRTSQDFGFDIIGAWLNQETLAGLFEKTPMYMKDIHEDEAFKVQEDDLC